MPKKYIVRLSEQERRTLREVVRKFKGSSAKVRRAQVLLKADADGPNWVDQRITDAFGCRTRTIENVRHRVVTQGFEAALEKNRQRHRRERNFWTARKKRKSSLCVWESHRKGLLIGRCVCWPRRL